MYVYGYPNLIVCVCVSMFILASIPKLKSMLEVSIPASTCMHTYTQTGKQRDATKTAEQACKAAYGNSAVLSM